MSIEQYINKQYLRRTRADLHLQRGEQIGEGLELVGQAVRGLRRRVTETTRRALKSPLTS